MNVVQRVLLFQESRASAGSPERGTVSLGRGCHAGIVGNDEGTGKTHDCVVLTAESVGVLREVRVPKFVSFGTIIVVVEVESD